MNQVARTAVLMLATAVAIPLGSAEAQDYSRPRGPSRSYNPSPTLSPYLDYFRAPTGPLDSYHEFVRPRMNLQKTLARQDRELRTQSRELRTLNSQWGEAQRTGTIAPTGTGAGFFNYSHFYPAMR